MKTTLLFDLGDTLAHYFTPSEYPAIFASCIWRTRDHLRRRGVPVASDAEIERRYVAERRSSPNHRVRPLAQRLSRVFDLKHHPLPTAEMMDVYRAFMAPIFARGQVYEDSLSRLESFRRAGYRIGLISNLPWGTPAELWREEIARLGLAPLLHQVTFCGDVGWRKPARPIFTRALELADARPEECAFIGDHPRWDVWGARRAGMDAVLIDRDGVSPEVDAPVVTSLAEFAEVVSRRWGA